MEKNWRKIKKLFTVENLSDHNIIRNNLGYNSFENDPY